MAEKRKLYVGLDIGTEYAMLSYYAADMIEPETVSRVAGSEVYQIPMLLYKRSGIGQWFYGEEAALMAKGAGEPVLHQLYERALHKETAAVDGQTYTYVELFALFLKKMLLIPARLDPNVSIEQLVLTTESLNRENMTLFSAVMEKLDMMPGHFLVIDHKESFYYYALAQKQELWLHDAVLFDYSHTDLRFFAMERNQKTTPQLVTIYGKNYGPLIGRKDIAFLDVLKDAIGKKILSAVYLTGDGFDGDWMEESVRYLCNGRRVFAGKNIYSKGASYAASVSGEVLDWKYIYMGENEMKMNVSLKVTDHGELAFYSLIQAGENWYEELGECEILLSGTTEIDFWLQAPDSREAKISTLELTDLPKREDRMTRLRIQAKPVSDHEVRVQIRDLGFGEICRSSDKKWEYLMKL
ncbi:MAG: DUF5716 family protein [Lachnospiraceae bacterium]|nr:DUF5716 family protein [Lachnospiraceae bacterium]